MQKFSKYQNAGNHFIFIEDTQEQFPLNPKSLEKLCHPCYGIGADGVILWQSSACYTGKMRIFNKDGKEAESCGNGLCCLGRFLSDWGYDVSKCSVEVLGGAVILSFAHGQTKVSAHYPKVFSSWQKITLPQKQFLGHFVDTGVPHFVVFLEEWKEMPLQSWGKAIRHHIHFAPKGTNVTFVKKHDTFLEARTYERGVENETKACGTAALAAAFVDHQIYGRKRKKMQVHFPGGVLEVDQDKDKIYLLGMPQKVYEGQFLLESFFSL